MDEHLYFLGLDRRKVGRRRDDHTETLAQAIVRAAKKCGMYNDERPLTGPDILLLIDDMAEFIVNHNNSTP